MMKTRPETDLPPYAAYALMGDSAAVRRLRLQMTRIAPHFRCVLISGEPGSGKMAIAQEMHRLSRPMGRGLLVSEITAFVNEPGDDLRGCTVLLRGLAATTLDMQDRLLRRLNLACGRIRVVVTCGADLRGMVASGRLRLSLCQRLEMLEIRVPSLGERAEDMAEIRSAMMARLAADAGAPADSPTSSEASLRELWRWCEQKCGRRNHLAAVPDPKPAVEPNEVPSSAGTLEEVVRRHVMQVLEHCAGNKLRAAEVLGISRSTLYRMLAVAGG